MNAALSARRIAEAHGIGWEWPSNADPAQCRPAVYFEDDGEGRWAESDWLDVVAEVAAALGWRNPYADLIDQ